MLPAIVQLGISSGRYRASGGLCGPLRRLNVEQQSSGILDTGLSRPGFRGRGASLDGRHAHQPGPVSPMIRPVSSPAAKPQSSALDYLRILIRRKSWVAACVVLVTAAAAAHAFTQAKVFSATASILVQPIPTTASLTGVTVATLAPTDVATQESVLGSSVISRLVTAKTSVPGTISVGADAGTNIVTVTATEPTAVEAARVANAYAVAYERYRSQEVAQSLGKAEAQLRARLRGIEALVSTVEAQLATVKPTSPTTQALQAQLQAALSNEGVVQGEIEDLAVGASTNTGAQIVSRAQVPASPSAPKKTRDVGLGLAAGLFLGIAAAFVVDSVDDSVRSKEDLEGVIAGHTPILGLIPEINQWKHPSQPFLASLRAPDSPPAEAYRSLRTALQFVLLDKRVKTILVSSPLPGEGKTATAANLGVAMARAGHRVLLVSGDLRRPRLGSFLGCDEGVGLSSVALGETDLTSAAVAVDGVKNLWFLGTGPLSAAPSELLSSSAVAEVMRTAATQFDYVIVDCPPILPVADTLAATQWSEGIILVARSRATRRRHIRRSLELIETADAPLIGAVLNDIADEALGYNSYHRYYGRYGTTNTKMLGDNRQRRTAARPKEEARG